MNPVPSPLPLEDDGAVPGALREPASGQESAGQEHGPWWPAVATGRALTASWSTRRPVVAVDLRIAGSQPLPRALPGQHVVLRYRLGGQWVRRSYTVLGQSVDGMTLQWVVRQEPEGRVTPLLLDALVRGEEVRVEVSAPEGPPIDLRASGLVLFAGGIGIATAMACLRDAALPARVHLAYSASTRGEMVFLDELQNLALRRAGFSLDLHPAEESGYIDVRRVSQVARAHSGARFVVCGPRGYLHTVLRGLRRAEVLPSAIDVRPYVVPGEPSAGGRWGSRMAWLVAGLGLVMAALGWD